MEKVTISCFKRVDNNDKQYRLIPLDEKNEVKCACITKITTFYHRRELFSIFSNF